MSALNTEDLPLPVAPHNATTVRVVPCPGRLAAFADRADALDELGTASRPWVRSATAAS
ncbi:MAG: hypothetical protein R2755_03950 [Acidimicrobiales bacterium]